MGRSISPQGSTPGTRSLRGCACIDQCSRRLRRKIVEREEGLAAALDIIAVALLFGGVSEAQPAGWLEYSLRPTIPIRTRFELPSPESWG